MGEAKNGDSGSSTKIAVVISGGGTRGAFSVGAMRALREAHGIIPDIVVTVSGGDAVGKFAAVGRFSQMYEWPRLFDDPRFISFSRLFTEEPIMDIDFLVDEIFMVQAPDLPLELERSGAKIFTAVTRYPEGIPGFLTLESEGSTFAHMKATKTISGVAHFWVEIGGVKYADGGFSASLSMCVEKAFAEGATKVILIDNSLQGTLSLPARALLQFRNRRAPQFVKEVVRRTCARTIIRLEAAHEKVIVCRKFDLPARHPLERRESVLMKTIEEGYETMARLKI